MAITPLPAIKTITPLTEKTSSLDSAKSSGSSFADVLSNAVGNVKDLETASNQGAYDLAMGKTDDVSSVMIQSAKAQTAVEMTVQITTRAVNAYKEIMQMQV